MENNSHNNIWKVYVHTNKYNGKRYVGITSLDTSERWRDGKGYSKQVFGKAVSKYGWNGFTHEVLFDNLSSTEANNIEQELISKWNTRDSRFGYNVTCGGGGINGFKFTDESRKKMSESAKHRNICYANRKKHPPISDETRAKMSKNNSGANNPNFGKKHTEESLRKMGMSHSKAVAIIDHNGEILSVFESAKKAADYLGVDKSVTAKVCRGVLKSCKGYSLMYV